METLTILYIIFGMCELITVDFDIVFVFTTSGIVGAACIILLAVFAYCYWKRGPGKKMTTNKSKIGQQQKTAQHKSTETPIKTKSASKTTTNSDQEEDGKKKKAKSKADKSALSKAFLDQLSLFHLHQSPTSRPVICERCLTFSSFVCFCLFCSQKQKRLTMTKRMMKPTRPTIQPKRR